MNRLFFLLSLTLLISVSLLAQISQLHIAGKPEKITVPLPKVHDINGRICAVIQILSDMEGFKYDSYNGIVKMIDSRGKDIVFLSPDERVLQIYHSGYQPLKIILAEHGIRLASQQGWEIKITAEKMFNLLPVVIDVYPDSVTVTIDDTDWGVGKLFMLQTGKHKIQLYKNGFIPFTDSIVVNKEHSWFDFVLAPQLEMVFVKGGTFKMGDTFGDGFSNEKPVHEVKVRDFFISKYEVLFVVYDGFCRETGRAKPYDRGKGRGKRPVYNVSWYDAVEFCNWLSLKHGFEPCYQIDKNEKDPYNKNKYDDLKWTVTCNLNANGYRLPTEAEWEYAGRGGNKSKGYKYSGTNKLDDLKTKIANELGICGMSNTIREWCWDWYDYNYYVNSPTDNPKGPVGGLDRVLRGNSWLGGLRISVRTAEPPYTFNDCNGFRVVRKSP